MSAQTGAGDGPGGAGLSPVTEVRVATEVVRRAAARRNAVAMEEGGGQPSDALKAKTLDAVVTEIQKRWGQGTIVKLGDVRRAVEAAARPKTVRVPDAPPWWPTEDGRRPRILEVIADDGVGALSLSLTWLAAVNPTLAAFVDTQHCFYPPSAAACGVDVSKLLVVRPPAATGKLAFDACVLLLKSEAFDAVVCAMPAEATDLKARTGLASYLARLTAQSGTSLVLVSAPHGQRPAGLLGSGADYRVRLVERRWRWRHGMLAGLRVRARSERARSSEGGAGVEHELEFGMGQAFPIVVGEPRYAMRSSTRLVGVEPAPAVRRVAEGRARYG